MKSRTFRSFAKINLGLEVVGRLPSGFHELKTIFATLSVHDTIELTETRGAISVQCDHPGVPGDATNLAHRAAVLIRTISGRKTGVAIRIRKRIAMGGGLGGGSSNAATVLRALDTMWGLCLGPSGLVAAAKSLGADVPYFLVGGPALGLGRGDEIHPLNLRLSGHPLLVQGEGGVSTASVFQQFARERRAAKPRSRIDGFLARADNQGPLADPAQYALLRNDLEKAALAVSPSLALTARRVRRVARETGAAAVAMSGSGSSFFLIFADRQTRRAAATALSALGITSAACEFVSKSSFERRFEVESSPARRRG